MANNNFDYPVPYKSELEELYITPYRFSDQLRDYVDYLFKHPSTKYGTLYGNLHKPFDSNDMLKTPYLIIRYYQDHPQQFGHQLNHLAPIIMVRMWKTFISLNKRLRGIQFSKYLAADLTKLALVENNFFDIFLNDIAKQNIIYTNDDMVKERKGVGLRERKNPKYTEKQMRYYESL